MSGADPLVALAQAAGLYPQWVDVAGTSRRVAAATLRHALDALGWAVADPAQCRDSLRRLQADTTSVPLLTVQAGQPLALDVSVPARWSDEHGAVEPVRRGTDGTVRAPARPGYWTLLHGPCAQAVAVAPARCFSVADACDTPRPRAWGLALQAYSARSPDDGGIGDAEGAADWARRAAHAGAAALALSPLHAARPVRGPYSPYSPSDRRFFDPLHAAPGRVLGDLVAQVQAREPALIARLRHLQAAELIDWPAAAQAKGDWLRALYAGFVAAPPALHEDLAAFIHAGSQALIDHAAFAAADFGVGDPRLHLFGQWLAARSWQTVQRDARAQGMAIGLIADLAVGFDPQGAEAAAWPQAVLPRLTLGAPPDAFNADGQSWGIGAYSPAALRATGYAPWRTLLAAVMRDRGGIRIDHILGLLRLWVVPDGARSRDGVYLGYPLQALLDLLALESWRHRAVVIGEDLGVVPPGIRQTLASRGVMGLDVLMFSRDRHGAFLPPAQWRADAVATTTTHDLPTLVGWRWGVDIAWRERLGLSGDADIASRRQAELGALERAIEREGGACGELWRDAIAYTARAPAPLTVLPVEDALALPQQPNLPGTVDVHPNWRRRLPKVLPEQTLDTALKTLADARCRSMVETPPG